MAEFGAKQTRRPAVDEPVEVVRDHEGGTSVGGWNPCCEGDFGLREAAVGCAAEGQALDESQERKDGISMREDA